MKPVSGNLFIWFQLIIVIYLLKYLKRRYKNENDKTI